MKITLAKVQSLYPDGKIVCVEEFMDKNGKWGKLLSDGMDVRDPDLYYRYGLNFVVSMCIKDGALEVCFKILVGNDCSYPDYSVRDLDEDLIEANV